MKYAKQKKIILQHSVSNICEVSSYAMFKSQNDPMLHQ